MISFGWITYFGFNYLYPFLSEAFSLFSIFAKVENLRLLNRTGVLAKLKEKIKDDAVRD
jgi:hypothetical protein